MGDIKTDLAGQQESLSKISDNTQTTNNNLDNVYEQLIVIDVNADGIRTNTNSIRTSSSNTATATSSLYSSVGTPADGSSANTVIGLLKSIANKL